MLELIKIMQILSKNIQIINILPIYTFIYAVIWDNCAFNEFTNLTLQRNLII